MKRYLLLVLIILLVWPASADTYAVNCSYDMRFINQLSGWGNLSVSDLRSQTASSSASAPSTTMGGYIYTGTNSSGYYNWMYDAGMYFPNNLPAGAIVTGGTLNVYDADYASDLGSVKLALIDFHPAGNTMVVGDYDATTWTRLADTDIVYTALNAPKTYTLNAEGISHINAIHAASGKNFTMMLQINRTVDLGSYGTTASSNSHYYVRPAEYLSGIYSPRLTLDYYIPPTIYPVSDPINRTGSQYLPDTTMTIDTGDHIHISSAKGEFESGSFVIRGNSNVTGMNISIPTLTDGGNTIPASDIDIKILMPWYNVVSSGMVNSINWSDPAPDFPYPRSGRFLVNELLWHNETKLARDDTSGSNYLLMRFVNGSELYQNLSSSTDTFPGDAIFDDSATIQPFKINSSVNKQMWVTVNVSSSQATGNYSGNMSLTNPAGAYLANITLHVRVRNFTLAASDMQYSTYYIGGINGLVNGDKKASAENKTAVKIAADLADMRKHGITNPIMHTRGTLSDAVNATIDAQLTALNQSGLPKDSIIWAGYYETIIGNVSTEPGITSKVAYTNYIKGRGSYFNFAKTYFHGVDEADETGTDVPLSSQRTLWTNIRLNGSYIITSGGSTGYKYFGNVVDVLDTGNVASDGYNITSAALFHLQGHKILLYAYPESGVPNPEIYRKNYGFRLYNGSYDGAGIWAWQHDQGVDGWNNFDKAIYGDDSFARGTSNGSVITLGAVGLREAIDDNRYVATMIDGSSATSANASVLSNISIGRLSPDIREQIANQIEYDILNPPEEPEPETSNIVILIINYFWQFFHIGRWLL